MRGGGVRRQPATRPLSAPRRPLESDRGSASASRDLPGQIDAVLAVPVVEQLGHAFDVGGRQIGRWGPSQQRGEPDDSRPDGLRKAGERLDRDGAGLLLGRGMGL